MMKSTAFPLWQQILCTLLYLAVFLLYQLTVAGVLRTKIPLIMVFAAPLAEHLFKDITGIIPAVEPLLIELSVLCIMAALFCTALAIKTTTGTDTVSD